MVSCRCSLFSGAHRPQVRPQQEEGAFRASALRAVRCRCLLVSSPSCHSHSFFVIAISPLAVVFINFERWQFFLIFICWLVVRCVAYDCSTKSRIDHAAQRFELPDTAHLQTGNKFVPPIFIIQLQIPSEPPSSLFSSADDGPGWSIVMYYRITEVRWHFRIYFRDSLESCMINIHLIRMIELICRCHHHHHHHHYFCLHCSKLARSCAICAMRRRQ